MDILIIIMLCFLACILGLIAYILIDNSKFKYRVEIREIVKGRKCLKHDRARLITDEQGVMFWKLKKEKNKQFKLMQNPPPQCIELDIKGRKCVTAYRDENGTYVFAEDNTTVFDDPKTYKPITTQQRTILIEQIKKAFSRNKKTWADNLHIIIPGFMLLIIIIGAMVFMEDVAKPFIKAEELHLQELEILNQNLLLLKEMQQDIQVIKQDKSLIKDANNIPD